jgi:hypothetical protein
VAGRKGGAGRNERNLGFWNCTVDAIGAYNAAEWIGPKVFR